MLEFVKCVEIAVSGVLVVPFYVPFSGGNSVIMRFLAVLFI